MPCSNLDQHVLKYFEAQLEQTGSHSWSCAALGVTTTIQHSTYEPGSLKGARGGPARQLEADQSKYNAAGCGRKGHKLCETS